MNIIIIKFFLGSILGSFSALVATRIFRHESIIMPRSHCDFCDHHLTPLELIPILSFIFLRGRCIKCKHAINISNWLMEIIVGCLFLKLSANLNSILEVSFYWGMILISLCDIKQMLIPVKLIRILLSVALIYRLTNHNLTFTFIAILMVTYIIASSINNYVKLIGNGDIDIIWIILIQTNTITALLSLLISACLAIIFQLIAHKQNEPIPYIPFLTIAFIIINII